MVVGFSSGLVAAGTGLVAIGAYAASAEARLNSKTDILEGKLSKEVAALKSELNEKSMTLDGKLSKEAAALAAKLDGIKEAINDEVDAKMAGSEKTIDAKIAVFEKFAGGKVRPFPSARVHHDPYFTRIPLNPPQTLIRHVTGSSPSSPSPTPSS